MSSQASHAPHHTLLFQPDGIKVSVAEGTTILEAAQRVGIVLNSVCGGTGHCGKCRVEIASLESQDHRVPPAAANGKAGRGSNQPPTEGREDVLACQHRVAQSMVVTIPEDARFFEQKILQEGIARESIIDPLVNKRYVELPEPTIDDLRSDAQRLTEALAGCGDSAHAPLPEAGNTSRAGSATPARSENSEHATDDPCLPKAMSCELLRPLPELLREHDFKVTAVCRGNEIIAIEPGDTRESLYGVAVDLGTTTVVASLIDLRNGHTRCQSSTANPQVAFGDDVISRVNYSTEHGREGLKRLQERIIGGINQLIDRLCAEAEIEPQAIYEMTCAGNATMQHLLLGVPVGQIAVSPYVGAFSQSVSVRAHSLGIEIARSGFVYVFPSVAGHIGGDTVAVALSAAMDRGSHYRLAVDIGTNGEIVAGNDQQLLTCSTAAGPAFEGARIRFGMRGAKGAIERIHLGGDDITLDVIGDAPPMGLCGSGLIDVLALLLETGLMDETGRLAERDSLPDSISEPLKQRLTEYDNQAAFRLTATDGSDNQAVYLTQRDIREAQLGIAAISAGIRVLLKELDITADTLEHLYLAGAFGNYINPVSARRVGLIPEVPTEKLMPIGNAAGSGAKEVLINRYARGLAESLASKMSYVELAARSDFQLLFSESMLFPTAR